MKLISAIAATLVALVAAAPASATFPGANGKLVYSTGGKVYSQDLSNPSATPALLNPGPGANNPMVSPDGTKIAYSVRVNDGLTAIAVANIDGTGQRILTTPGMRPSEYDGSPSWSPDGTQLAFTRTISGDNPPVHEQVRVLNVAAGGNGTVLVDKTNGPFVRTEWSPDGTKIAAEQKASDGSFATVRNDLFLLTPAGGSQLLRQGPVIEQKEYPGGRRISWTPNGKRLAYAPQDGTQILFYTVAGAADGTLALSGAERIGAIAYMPDGASMLIQRCLERFGNCRIYKRTLSSGAETDLGAIGPTYDRTLTHFDVQALKVVQNDPPETIKEGGPEGTVKTKKKAAKVTFEFSADEPATFECELDGAKAEPCESPLTVSLEPGKHELKVTAIDLAGLRDRTPATWELKVKRVRK